MKLFLLGLSLFAAQIAHADRGQCVKSLSSLMKNVESDVRSMAKSDASVHNFCVMWLYNRGQYDKIKKQNGGEDPCPSKSNDWKNILNRLMTAHSDAKALCKNKQICEQGCGNALSVIRSGGSLQVALLSVPK